MGGSPEVGFAPGALPPCVAPPSPFHRLVLCTGRSMSLSSANHFSVLSLVFGQQFHTLVAGASIPLRSNREPTIYGLVGSGNYGRFISEPVFPNDW